MMEKQEIKIEYNDNKVFFFAHSLKTASDHAEDFIKRNIGKFEMKVYTLNTSNHGEKWLLKEVIKEIG